CRSRGRGLGRIPIERRQALEPELEAIQLVDVGVHGAVGVRRRLVPTDCAANLARDAGLEWRHWRRVAATAPRRSAAPGRRRRKLRAERFERIGEVAERELRHRRRRHVLGLGWNPERSVDEYLPVLGDEHRRLGARLYMLFDERTHKLG